MPDTKVIYLGPHETPAAITRRARSLARKGGALFLDSNTRRLRKVEKALAGDGEWLYTHINAFEGDRVGMVVGKRGQALSWWGAPKPVPPTNDLPATSGDEHHGHVRQPLRRRSVEASAGTASRPGA